jgi:hypothetical protein
MTTPTPQRYRKRPVVVEAIQWRPDQYPDVGVTIGWLMANGVDFHHPSGTGDTTTLAIRTLEGEMVAQPGDWIIRGVKGEFYPCKHDIFETTYEPAATTGATP